MSGASGSDTSSNDTPGPSDRRALLRRRVAVTGMGALSPGGVGVGAYGAWAARRAVPEATGAAERIADFDPTAYIHSPKLLRSMHRTFQLVAAAAVLAMRSAGLPTAESLPAAGLAPERAGLAAALADLSPLTADLLQVLAQTASGDPSRPLDWAQFAELGLHSLHPFRRLTLLANMAAAHTSLLYGLQGPSFTFTSGAAAGGQTIVQAFWTVSHGRADLMLCQTAESPEQAFSAHPPAEVAGALVIEDWAGAQRRGAAILGELVADHSGRALALATTGSPASSLMAALLQLEARQGQPGAVISLAEILEPLGATA